MTLNLKTIRLQDALHAIREFQDADHLIVLSEESLVSVNWTSLQHTPDTLSAIFGRKGQGRILANPVAIDNAFAIDSQLQRILLARQGEISIIDPIHSQEQKVNVPGLPRGTFAAAINPHSQQILFVTVRVSKPDFAMYTVTLADLTTGVLTPEKTVSSSADLELLWDDLTHTWAIGDTAKGALWRWDGSRQAVKLAAPDEPIISATFAATADGVIVSAVATNSAGTEILITGRAEQDRIAWEEPVPLPSGVLMARRHPVHPLWACLAHQGSAQHIKLVDHSGRLLAAVPLPRSSHLEHLQWSTFSPNRLWGFGVHALAAASIVA